MAVNKRMVATIPNPNGTITFIFDDGSFAIMSTDGQIIDRDDSPNPLRAAAVNAGDRAGAIKSIQQASAEDARRFDAGNANAIRELDNRAREIQNAYEVNMRNARTNADQQRAQAQYWRDTAQLARDQLSFDRYSFDQTHALDREKFGLDRQRFGLEQAQLGYNLIETGARLHNDPLDYFNEEEWARGVAGRPETSTFLSALQNNTRLADFSGRGDPAEVNSLAALTGKLQGNGGNPNTGNYLAQIGNIGAKGPHQLGAGALEQLTPTEMKLLTGGLSKLGYNPDTFLAGYRRSRIGQGFSSAGAA